jgi:hypothetical protein
MKKVIIALLLSAVALVPQLATADPSVVELAFTCPTTTGTDIHTLANFGNRIAGYGTETLAGTPAINLPFFSTVVATGANIPAKLNQGSYANDATDFDNINSFVSCHYASFGGYDAFTVYYFITNGRGGVITSQTPNTISINVYVGMR